MWWHILGVEADADKKVVKKAYAKIIKGVDQDNDIDEFTKIHHAFRIAMKSFKKVELEKGGGLVLDESPDDYIYYLKNIYADEKKRLNPKTWKDAFACMSFKEEEYFKEKYIEFFNENYLLVEEIWKLVDKQYPLRNQKTFKWSDLYNGTFSVTMDELTNVPKVRQCHYVKHKISIYYKVLNKELEEALEEIKDFLEEFKDIHILRWYMSVAISLSNEEEIESAYKLLMDNGELKDDGHYMKAGYLTSIGDYSSSKSELLKISNKNMFVSRLEEENEQGLLGKEINSVKNLPWNELKFSSKKKVKLLSNGNFVKAIKSENSSFLSFMNKGGRG